MYTELIREELGLEVHNEYILLDVAQPLTILVETKEKYLFVHILQDRTIVTRDRKRASVLEILVAETTINKTLAFVNGEINLGEMLNGQEFHTIGSIANRIYPKRTFTDFEKVKNKVPDKDFVLSTLIPNRVDLSKLTNELNELKNII